MFKYAAIGILFLGCTFLGFNQGEKYRVRLINLAELKKAVMLLKNEVIFYNTPLPEAFIKIAPKLKEPFNKIFEELANNLNKDSSEGVYTEFVSIYENYKAELKFNKDDLNVLEDFLKSLGESGVYGQEQIFKVASDNLNSNYVDADKEAKQNIKMYRTLGICSGAMLAIFFL